MTRSLAYVNYRYNFAHVPKEQSPLLQNILNRKFSFTFGPIFLYSFKEQSPLLQNILNRKFSFTFGPIFLYSFLLFSFCS